MDARAVAEYRRVLKQGGTLLIPPPTAWFVTSPTSCHEGQPVNPFHIREYAVEEFENLLRGLVR